jgi:hypothetical protein
MLASAARLNWLRLSEKGNSMATNEQIAANRRNAKKSTGPTSPAGKAAASMNNLRHGLSARTIILPGETQEEFDEILAGLQQEYQPQSSSEHYLVREAAVAHWKLGRAAAYEASCCEKNPDLSACCALFSRMTLVTGRLQRIYLKFYKESERIKSARAAAREAARDKQPEQPNEPSTEKSSTEKSSAEQSAKEKKEMDDMGGPNLDVFWVDPETGVRDYLYRRRDGKNLPLPPKTG